MALSLGATPAISATARAAERLGDAPAAFVQADLLDLPFTPRRFVNVACCGTLHVLDDPSAALIALAGQLAPVGKLPRLDAVTDRTVGRAYLAALHRAGAGGRPRRAEELAGAARAVFGSRLRSRARGRWPGCDERVQSHGAHPESCNRLRPAAIKPALS